MSTKITDDLLESYLQCNYKGYLKLSGASGAKSEYESLFQESKKEFTLTAVAKLIQRKRCDVARGIFISLEMLKRGVPLLLDAVLEDENFSVRFDALQRDSGHSLLGNFHYVPVLFYPMNKPNRTVKALIELYSLILDDIQGNRKHLSRAVFVHGRVSNLKTVKLKPNSDAARQTIRRIKEIQSQKAAPNIRLNDHCKICEFRQRCQTEAEAKDDLSLLSRLGEKQIKKYNSRGIFTVNQLSYTFRARKRSKRSKSKMPSRDPALQALAIRERKIYVIGAPNVPSCPNRIYFDVESGLDNRSVYLIGMVVDRNGAKEHYSFWSDTEHEESTLFRQFLGVLAKYDDYVLYSYGAYEAGFLRRMIEDADRQDIAEKLFNRYVNLLSVIYSHLYFPTYSNSLKHIAKYLGYAWTDPDASSIQSLVWRKKWEMTASDNLKETLITYNLDDCAALEKVAAFVSAISAERDSPSQKQSWMLGCHELSRVEESVTQWSRREWCKADFVIPDFEFVNQRAYFDYQRDRVFVRTSKVLKKSIRLQHKKKGKKNPRFDRSVEINASECPYCAGTMLTRKPDRRLSRWVFDLRFKPSGIRRYTTRCTTSWHWCSTCGERFLPRPYLRLDEHAHSLKSWAMYEHVVHSTSHANIAETLRDCFGLFLYTGDVHSFKEILSRYYEETYQQILEKLVAGDIVHADETEVHVCRAGKGYVWVFTNLEEVFLEYRRSREGVFLSDMFANFRGVLISDFYTAYDSLPCEQQKCLIHLIRDFNHDLLQNPYDDDLKSIASAFGSLLRNIVATVDRFGLRQRHLGKHRGEVSRFFRIIESRSYESEVAQGFAKRLLKYESKLFTFVRHDGVPWNNNNAEHAIKHFASYRKFVDGRFSETGLREYLVLLSVYLTCKYKGVNFLRFMLSRGMDIEAFRKNSKLNTPEPAVELCPEGFAFSRRKRPQDWDRAVKQTESLQSKPKQTAWSKRAIRSRLAPLSKRLDGEK